MSNSIQIVIELGLTDAQLLTLRRELKALEKQIQDARVPLNALEKSHQAKQQEYDLTHKASQQKKETLQAEESQIAKMEAQVPLIRNQKEFVASKKQLEDARKRKGLLEDEVLTLDIKKEEQTKELEALRETLTRLTGEFETSTQILHQRRTELTQELETQLAKQKQLLASSETAIQKFYQKCLARGTMPAICAMLNKGCSGCHFALPPQMVNDFLTQPNIYRHCPNCQRIVYYVPEPKSA